MVIETYMVIYYVYIETYNIRRIWSYIRHTIYTYTHNNNNNNNSLVRHLNNSSNNSLKCIHYTIIIE